MCLPILVVLCPLVLMILSRTEILTSIKGCNSIANLPRMMFYNPNIDLLMCIQNLVKFCYFILKILSGNEILILNKGCNSVANLPKMMFYKPNLDPINVHVYKKFGLILSIHFQDIERKRNSNNSVISFSRY